jgi:hypothetical protein
MTRNRYELADLRLFTAHTIELFKTFLIVEKGCHAVVHLLLSGSLFLVDCWLHLRLSPVESGRASGVAGPKSASGSVFYWSADSFIGFLLLVVP